MAMSRMVFARILTSRACDSQKNIQLIGNRPLARITLKFSSAKTMIVATIMASPLRTVRTLARAFLLAYNYEPVFTEPVPTAIK